MNRRMPRALLALCAAVISLAAFCVAIPAAVADTAPQTVYVDGTSGSDANDCVTTPCQTITHALQVVADGGTVNVAAAAYAEDLAPTRRVTIVGNTATLDGTLDIHSASVEVTGITFAGTVSPQVRIDDPNTADTVTVHADTFTESGQPAPTAIGVDSNAASTSITDNSITGAADGIDVISGGADSQYTITGNQFALESGGGTAIALTSNDPDQINAVVGANSGTISATGHAITRSGAVAVTQSGSPNTITSTATSLTPSSSSTSLITEQAAEPFTTATTSNLDLTGAKYDVGFTATGGITAGEVDLRYSTDNKTFNPVDLSAGAATLAAGAGIPGVKSATVYYLLSANSTAPAGTVTLTMTVDQPDGPTGPNTVASTQFTATVQPNSAPTATPQSVSVQRNGTIRITLTGSDPDTGDSVTNFTIDTSGTDGTAVQSPTDPSTVTYTAPANFSGTDTFAFVAIDNHENASIPVTVTVTVGPNTGPSATDISVPRSTLMSHAGANTIDLSGGVSDPDGDSLTYSVVPIAGITGGTVSPSGHSALYTPSAATIGVHAFEYRVFDGDAYSNWAVVSFAVDTPPVAAAQQGLTVSHVSTTPLAIPTLTATDSDAPANDTLHYSVPTSGVDYPSHGKLTGTAPDNLTYTPDTTYAGPDQFRFTVTDNYGASSTAVVSIAVTDQPPVAPNIATTIPYALGVRTISLPGSDPDGDAVTYSLVSPAPSFLSLNTTTGVVTVDQTTAHETAFQFSYAVNDVLTGPTRSPTSGAVTVNVNTPPVAQPATLLTGYGTPASGTLRATDADGITSYSFGSPSHGHLSERNFTTGAFTYTPNSGFVGTDSFTFTAADALDTSTPAKMSITVAKAMTSMSVSISIAHPTSAEQPIATVKVTSAGNESNGLVTIKTGGFGTPTGRVKNGKATITLPQFAGGAQSITAVYAGTKTTAPATSNQFGFTVTKVASRIAFKTNPLQLTTSTTNATATVTVTAGPFRPSGGTVTIDENGNRLAQGTPRVGVVTLHLPQFSLGQHNLTVGYTGTDSIATSSVVVIERVSLG